MRRTRARQISVVAALVAVMLAAGGGLWRWQTADGSRAEEVADSIRQMPGVVDVLVEEPDSTDDDRGRTWPFECRPA